jgi:hypothetical protein
MCGRAKRDLVTCQDISGPLNNPSHLVFVNQGYVAPVYLRFSSGGRLMAVHCEESVVRFVIQPEQRCCCFKISA